MGKRWRRAGRGNRRALGLVLAVLGCGVLAHALPGWVWLATVGGALVGVGYFLMEKA